MMVFLVVVCFLDDFKIFNLEIGCLVFFFFIICDVCNWVIMMMNYIVSLVYSKLFSMIVGFIFLIFLFLVIIVYGICFVVLWVVSCILEGSFVKEMYICVVFVILMICGFIGEFIGIIVFGGFLVLGLVILDGLLLGVVFVEKFDSFVEVFMLLFFVVFGLEMNFFVMK